MDLPREPVLLSCDLAVVLELISESAACRTCKRNVSEQDRGDLSRSAACWMTSDILCELGFDDRMNVVHGAILGICSILVAG